MSQSDGHISLFQQHHTEKKSCRHALSLKNVNKAHACIRMCHSQPSRSIFHKNIISYWCIHFHLSSRYQGSCWVTEVTLPESSCPSAFVSLSKRLAGSTSCFHSNKGNVCLFLVTLRFLHITSSRDVLDSSRQYRK